MANKIRKTLTDRVLHEILSWFYETSVTPGAMESMLGHIDTIAEVETLDDVQRFLETMEGMNMQMVGPWRAILSCYRLAKRGGLQVADKTGQYICPGCKRCVFKEAKETLTPCRCLLGKPWEFFWDHEARLDDAETEVVAVR